MLKNVSKIKVLWFNILLINQYTTSILRRYKYEDIKVNGNSKVSVSLGVTEIELFCPYVSGYKMHCFVIHSGIKVAIIAEKYK